MRFYLASWVGDGTEDNEYRPNVDAASWAAIDLRPDSTVAEGRVLVATEQPAVTVTAGVADLGDSLDERLRTPTRRGIESALGVTLDAETLRGMVAELLIFHGESDLPGRTRWKRLRADRTGRHVIKVLGSVIFDAPAVAGVTLTDDFNRPDSANLGGSWTEITDTWSIVSNQARASTGSGEKLARLELDLSGADQSAEIDVVSVDTSSFPGPIVRYSTSTKTFYHGRADISSSNWQIYKWVSGSATQLTSTAGASTAAPYRIRLDVEGSALELFKDDVSQTSTTDTDIAGNLRTGMRAFHLTTVDNFEANDLAAGQNVAVNTASEVETAQPITPVKTILVDVGQVAEVETALPITASKPILVDVGTVTERELANPVTVGQAQTVAVGLVTERELALAITPVILEGGVLAPIVCDIAVPSATCSVARPTVTCTIST